MEGKRDREERKEREKTGRKGGEEGEREDREGGEEGNRGREEIKGEEERKEKGEERGKKGDIPNISATSLLPTHGSRSRGRHLYSRPEGHSRTARPDTLAGSSGAALRT